MISFVVVARNDNYGGDFLYRMQTFVNVLLTLCEKHALKMELVIVEWNPPQNSPRLADVLKWINSLQYCHVRIIEVSEELHRQLPYSDSRPLLEFTGKNVGVHRSRGEFILVTNPDILFSEELIRFLATENLSPKCSYRATRYDVEGPLPADIPVEKMLAYCQQHITQINAYLGSFNNRLSERFGFRRILYAWLDYIIFRLRYFPYALPFTNASGDFMLMHRSHWHFLRGYPQIEGWYHIDSLLVYMALFRGLKQIRLGNRLRIYHQSHGRPENDKPFAPAVESSRRQLLEARKPIIFNDETWGLGQHDLPETLIA